MEITWFGHAAFGVTGRNPAGEPVRIVLDPYNYPGCGGYLPVDVETDIVSVSHDNVKYHSDTSSLRGEFELLPGLDYVGSTRSSHGISFQACEVYENDQGEGPNAMVKFTLEGVTIAHQGDLGHAVAGPALGFLKGCDVLLALAGGPPTIELVDLRELLARVRPAIVMPMHYLTDRVNLDIQPIESVLEALAEYPVMRTDAHTVTIDRESLPDSTTVWVVNHAR